MPNANRNIQPLFENDDLAVFTKPAGMETIDAGSGSCTEDFTTLVRTARNEAGLAPVHRLDRDTSGVLMFARSVGAEKALTDLFRRRQTQKTYLALCLGVPRNTSGTINRRLSEWSGGHKPVRVLKKGGLEASTSYRVLAASELPVIGSRVGLLAFFPHQGRTHQIRVHAAAFGYPILGDDQYGDREANRRARVQWDLRRQALHSWRLGFSWQGVPVEAVSPLLEDMAGVCESLWGVGWSRGVRLPKGES